MQARVNLACAAQSGARLDGLAATLTKPLRCLWVSQHSRIWLNQVTEARALPFTPIILASASDPAAAQAHRSLREPALPLLLWVLAANGVLVQRRAGGLYQHLSKPRILHLHARWISWPIVQAAWFGHPICGG